MKKGIMDRLCVYRRRKICNCKESTKILLKWKHMLEIEAWIKSCGLTMEFFRTIVGYKVLGMIIIDKGE